MKKILFSLPILSILLTSSMYSDDESTIMAKYLVSISRYIQWPDPMNTGTFTIGVVGDFKVYRAIAEETMGTGIQNRNVDVINFPRVENAKLAKLNMLILPASYSTPAEIKKALALIGSAPTILVTHNQGSLHNGSAINFVNNNGKLGFEMHRTNLMKNGILVSKQVDIFAVKVYN